MKEYLKEYLQRANLHQIGSFLTSGMESLEASSDYAQCIDTAWDDVSAQLDEQIADKRIRDDVRTLIFAYANAIEAAYLTLGLKAGARLLLELLNTP